MAQRVQPVRISKEAHVIESFWMPPGAPVGVHMNTMVLASQQPVVFDTGVPADREGWLSSVGSVVDPDDVRWIVITHDDHDHTGNLEVAMEQFPNASVVVSWWMAERLTGSFDFDPRRTRWVVSGESLDIGDRTLVFARPPLFDSPTTRAVFDPSTGLYWGGDFGAAPGPAPASYAEDVPADVLADSVVVAAQWISPWYAMLDDAKYQQALTAFERLGVTTWAHTHGGVYRGPLIGRTVETLRTVTSAPWTPQPGQAELDALMATALVPA